MVQNSDIRIIKAARKTARDFPYFYPAISRVRFMKDNKNTPTMSINCFLVIRYNEDFIEKLSDSQLNAVILHEILHYINGHHERHMNNPLRNTLPYDIHNIAMDIEINEIIADLYGDDNEDNLYDEPVYYFLPEDAYRAKDFDFPERKTYEEYLQLINIINKNLERKDQIIMPGNDLNLDNYSKDYKDALNELIEECKEHERSTESGAFDINRRVKKIKYRWEQVFQNILAAKTTEIMAGFRYRTFEKANRRYIHTPDIILPVFIDRKVKISFAIIMDISGSMCDTVDKMYGVMKSIIDIHDMEIDITVLEVNIDVENIIHRLDLKRETIKSKDGGGTDMGAGLRYIWETGMESDLIIVMTDSYTPWPDPPILANKTIVLTDHPEFYNGPYPMYPVEFGKI
jgi:predicted metal-dependent peptidase